MQKFLIKIIFCFIVVLSFNKLVNAKECFYNNPNGVCFSEEEYQFLTNMYWDGSQDLFNEGDYQKFINSDLLKGELETVEIPIIIPYSTDIADNLKRLKISKVCTTNCNISVTATWLSIPANRSYDVIGARLVDVSLINNPLTTVTSSTQSKMSSSIKKFDNGFGVSIELVKTGTNVIVNQTFKTTKGGTIYASYQHAISPISLNDSQKFSISSTGYGKVFKFNGVATTTYDKMSGVDIAV